MIFKIIKPPQELFDFGERLMDIAIQHKENVRNTRYPFLGMIGCRKVSISSDLGTMQFEIPTPFDKNSNTFVNDTVLEAGGNIKKFDWAPNQKLGW